MTERDIEGRLRELYRLDAARTVPASLRRRVIALPESTSPPVERAAGRRRAELLFAATLLLGGLSVGAVVVGSGLVVVPTVAEASPAAPSSPAPSSPVPSPPLPELLAGDPAAVEPCSLLSRAVARAGLEEGRFNADHGAMFWDAKVCINASWDGSWEDRHLLFRTQRTSRDEAVELLESVRLGLAVSGTHEFGGWAADGPGVWTGRWSRREGAEQVAGFDALVVSAEPYFFAVTGRDPAETRAVAEAILLELRAVEP